MPRVLHLVWNLIRGGTEGQCARVAMALAEQGWAQRVGVFRREGFFLGPVERACGSVHVVEIATLASMQTCRAVRRLAGFIRAEKIDLVHTWDADAAVFGSIAARLAGVPCVTSRRDLGEIYPAWKLWRMRRADAHARAVVVNARAIADAPCCRHLSPGKARVIPNILDLREFDERFQAPPAGLPPLPAPPRIVMVARLDPEKDVPTLLRAMIRVVGLHREARLAIIGEGGERPSLEAMCRDLGLPSHVAFLGEQTQVPALLRGAAIGVLVPNRNEGLSNTILEYMAAGLPVVATDCGGNRELVDDGVTGRVVPAGDDAAVADAIVSLLREPERARQMGVAGRRRIEQNHQPAAVAAQFAAVYHEAAGR